MPSTGSEAGTSPPRFSIVLPTYNRARLVGRAIESVVRQRYPSWELVVVDDGSTDDTRDVVQGFGDARIRYLWKRNEERSIARNFGIDAARGAWVAFLDSDDFVLETHLATAAEYIEEHPDVAFFHLGYAVRGGDGLEGEVPSFPSERGALRMLLRENPLSTNAIFVRRELLRDVRFPDSREAVIGEDWSVWLRLAARHPLRLDRRVTSCVVSHPGRTVGTFHPDAYRRAAEVLLRTFDADPVFRDALGPSSFRWFRSYLLLGVGQHFLIGTEPNPKVALRWVLRAATHDPRVVFTIRFAACLKKLVGLALPGRRLARPPRPPA
jgi:glycosyltransferase involved in cell wall biosynthesis